MIWCEINLARDLVLSAQRRKRVYRAMIIYLALTILALAVSTLFATKNIVQGISLYGKSQKIQKHFKQTYPEKESLPVYANELKTELKVSCLAANEIQSALPAKTQPLLPLIAELLNPTDNSLLCGMNFLQKPNEPEPSLEFSLCWPTIQRTQPAFLQQWRKNEQLRNQFAAITPATTKRERIDGVDVFIMSYKALFR
jgi:hypothetical protein